MTPRFILPSGYTPRDMQLVLSRSSNRKGWQFFGRDHMGYCVSARDYNHALLRDGAVFPTKEEAAIVARSLNLPAYATWNGRKRCYDGAGEIIRAYPRDYTKGSGE